jgi:hypothetical protein
MVTDRQAQSARNTSIVVNANLDFAGVIEIGDVCGFYWTGSCAAVAADTFFWIRTYNGFQMNIS